MKLEFTVRPETFALTAPFSNHGQIESDVEVVIIELFDGQHRGRGECSPKKSLGESAGQVINDINSIQGLIANGITRDALQHALPAGPARNALDCSLWDLESKQKATPVYTLAGLKRPEPVQTAYTLSFGTPEEVAKEALAVSHRPLLKLKLGGPDDAARIQAARSSAPNSVLIADANGGWSVSNLLRNLLVCAENGVRFIEQPLPPNEDSILREIRSPIPICADESVTDALSLSRLVGQYQLVNLKLDKTGGLTDALHFLSEASRLNFGYMIGCRSCTSLGIAPALLLVRDASFVDLDGPLFLSKDRFPGIHYENSTIEPPSSELWG